MLNTIFTLHALPHVSAERNGCMLSRGRGAQAPLLDDACRWVDHAVMTRLTNHSLPFVP